jgi:hypothetical protein
MQTKREQNNFKGKCRKGIYAVKKEEEEKGRL